MVRCRSLLSCLVAALFVTLAAPAAIAAEEYSEAKLQSFASAVLAVNEVVEQWRPQIQAASSETDRQLARVFEFIDVRPCALAALKEVIDQEWHFLGSASVRRFTGDINRSSHDIGLVRRLAVQAICGQGRAFTQP